MYIVVNLHHSTSKCKILAALRRIRDNKDNAYDVIVVDIIKPTNKTDYVSIQWEPHLNVTQSRSASNYRLTYSNSTSPRILNSLIRSEITTSKSLKLQCQLLCIQCVSCDFNTAGMHLNALPPVAILCKAEHLNPYSLQSESHLVFFCSLHCGYQSLCSLQKNVHFEYQ